MAPSSYTYREAPRRTRSGTGPWCVPSEASRPPEGPKTANASTAGGRSSATSAGSAPTEASQRAATWSVAASAERRVASRERASSSWAVVSRAAERSGQLRVRWPRWACAARAPIVAVSIATEASAEVRPDARERRAPTTASRAASGIHGAASVPIHAARQMPARWVHGGPSRAPPLTRKTPEVSGIDERCAGRCTRDRGPALSRRG